MVKIAVTPQLFIDDSEIEERFIHASGPGGQNVNKVATAVQLRFDVGRSPSLPDIVRERLLLLGGSRITNSGVLVIGAQSFRTQDLNRADARKRLLDLIRRAAAVPKPRYQTRPTLASQRERFAAKRARSALKHLRTKPAGD